MKEANILIIVLIAVGIPLQPICAQTSPCPDNHKKAEQVLEEYLSKEKNIQSLQNLYDIPVSNNAKDHIVSLSAEANKAECRQLISNLDWLEKVNIYSIYKVAGHYFIVVYSLDKDGKFQWSEIQIVNTEYKFLASVLNV